MTENKTQPEEDYIIICEEGIVKTTNVVLYRIPYFKSIIDGGFKESKEKIIMIEDASLLALQNIINYYTSDVYSNKIKLPATMQGVEECLGLANYLDAKDYTKDFIWTYVSENTKDKSRHVDVLNLLSTVDRMKDHINWVGLRLTNIVNMPRMHMLLPETIQQLVTNFKHDKKKEYLFPLIREWYLFDKNKAKVDTIIRVIDDCPINNIALMSVAQTRKFVDVFPDPCIARKIALYCLANIKTI